MSNKKDQLTKEVFDYIYKLGKTDEAKKEMRKMIRYLDAIGEFKSTCRK